MQPSKTDLTSPVFTVKEVSDYLKVHQSTIYRLLKRGSIPGWKLGSDWRFNKNEIDRWIAEQTARATE